MTDWRELRIDEDVATAATLPGRAYTDPHLFQQQVTRLFPHAWHLMPGPLPREGALAPWTLLEGCLDEPLLVTREHASLHCLSNVCTHRGNILVSAPCEARAIRCPYHGRRFGLDGGCRAAPGFEGAADVPSRADDLPRVPFHLHGDLLFASLEPTLAARELLAPVIARTDWLPLDRARLDPESTRIYDVPANWALYCDNYLEGFHIAYVHKALAKAIELDGYANVLFPHGTLQLAVAAPDEPAFEPPASHPDHGRRVAAYYFWLFPCTMLNFYPWGLSVNVVMPAGVDRTRVAFLAYVWDDELRGRGAGGDLDRVELEDEAVVATVQRGVRSRLYHRGRYSPRFEVGVHHFHRLLVDALSSPR